MICQQLSSACDRWNLLRYWTFWSMYRRRIMITSLCNLGGPRGRVVKVADFIIALDHSIISPLWLVWVRAPHGSQVRQVKFYLWVCQVVFPGVLPFSPHLLIGSSRYEWNNLERDVKLNKKKMIGPFWTKFYFVLGPNIIWAFHRTIGPLVIKIWQNYLLTTSNIIKYAPYLVFRLVILIYWL